MLPIGAPMKLLNRLVSAVLMALAAGLIWLGGQLLLAGGSPYYVIAALLLAATSWQLWRQSNTALTLFAALWLGTLLWAIWESGLNGWTLAGRLGLLTGIGLWLLTPWVRKSLGLSASSPLSRTALGLAMGLAIGGTAWVFWNDRITGGTDLSHLAAGPSDPDKGDWTSYGNVAGGNRFSPLVQITPDNVGALTEAWRFSLGKEPNGEAAPFEATPLKVGDKLFFCTGYNDIIALDAETGKQVWRYKSHTDADGIFGQTCRGVTYFKAPNSAAGTVCAARVYTATIDSRLLAVDAETGKPCADFGLNGAVNLLKGMSAAPKGYYHMTSPPTVIAGKLVLGGWVTDGQMIGEPSGVIRAYDAISGKLAWAWDIGRSDRSGEPGRGETYTPGTPNSWSVMSADPALGLVYVPMGNATPDYYGGQRTAEMDKYSSAVVALDASTGKPRWHFQTTHHDLWDYDVASQPVLVDLADGRPALLQPTKRGELFMLDRRTGKPIAQVTEKKVPVSNALGERSSPTQPFSTGLPNFTGTMPSEKTMWGVALIDQAWCRLRFKQARFDGPMT
ncbi:MAG: hypothetical protein RLZZ136_779, partial [Pseudomonadota bacterium]